jgi:DNA-binding MarR family transcriptional regulator
LSGLKLQIVQEPPFFSEEEEALLNLMRTADYMHRAFHLKARDWGVTSTQYNVLRILRGAHPHGLTCSAIGTRMITAEPDITRLLSRLKTLKLVRQQRDHHDRRVVWTRISESGLQLLKEMDPVIQRAPIDLLGHLSRTELAEFIRLLELARSRNEEYPAPVRCDGGACKTDEAAADQTQPTILPISNGLTGVTGPKPSAPQIPRPHPSE